MSDKDAEIAALKAEVARANETNRALHRRAQAAEGPHQAIKAIREFWWQAWRRCREAEHAAHSSHRRAEAELHRERIRATTAEARVAELEAGLKPFADAAREFSFALGGDGVDDGLTVTAFVEARREREAVLSTADFSHAYALLNKDKTNG